jgi:two-component system, LytTR family, response regulator
MKPAKPLLLRQHMINRLKQSYQSPAEKRLFKLFLLAVVAILTIAIFQDFLQAKRNGNSFFFSESLLFKSFWVFFPPILLLLKYVLVSRPVITLTQIGFAVLTATVTHLILVPLTIWCLSALFREQSYGFFKVLTYTLSNDLVKILLIYAVFTLWLKHIASKSKIEALEEQATCSEYLAVSSGKNNTRIKLSDILYIKAATPYIAIQLENKQYLHSESLKSILVKLDARFVRVHKSSIVNIDKVLSYKSRLNGDYDLKLQDGIEIRLSRNYVNDFKNHFETSPQLNP